jgi:Skp family chaperone for outer membrane proteins
MSTGPQQPPGGAPAPGALPPDPNALPATKGDIRDLRRWLIVAGVWAVAASAIAIIALISGNDSNKNSDRTSTDVSAQVARVQRALNKRIDDLDSKIQQLPTSDDVSKLDSRLKSTEDKSSQAATDAKDARTKVTDLETRVKSLEQSQQGSGGTSTSPP